METGRDDTLYISNDAVVTEVKLVTSGQGPVAASISDKILVCSYTTGITFHIKGVMTKWVLGIVTIQQERNN